MSKTSSEIKDGTLLYEVCRLHDDIEEAVSKLHRDNDRLAALIFKLSKEEIQEYSKHQVRRDRERYEQDR